MSADAVETPCTPAAPWATFHEDKFGVTKLWFWEAGIVCDAGCRATRQEDRGRVSCWVTGPTDDDDSGRAPGREG